MVKLQAWGGGITAGYKATVWLLSSSGGVMVIITIHGIVGVMG